MRTENNSFDSAAGSVRTDASTGRRKGDCISRKAVIAAFKKMEVQAAGDDNDKAVKLMKALQEFIEIQPDVGMTACRTRRMAEYRKRIRKAAGGAADSRIETVCGTDSK